MMGGELQACGERHVVFHLLTDRQAELVRLACAGMSVREIAASMGIRAGTARVMLTEARMRLGTHAIAG